SSPSWFDWSRFPDHKQCGQGVWSYYMNVYHADVCWSGNCPTAATFWLNNTPDPSKFNRHPWSTWQNGTVPLQAEDIVVFERTHSDTTGHAALVDHVDAHGVVWIMDDNWWGGERKASCPLGHCGWAHDFHSGYPPYTGWVPYGIYRLKSKEP